MILKIGMRAERSETFTTQHITKKQSKTVKEKKAATFIEPTTFGLQTEHSIPYTMDGLTNFRQTQFITDS